MSQKAELLKYSRSFPNNALREAIDALRFDLEEKNRQIVRLQDEIERCHRLIEQNCDDNLRRAAPLEVAAGPLHCSFV
uniref:Uncharacterized protein n=1 Tax=Oryza punctata TaxID=4537 RepID=A0A0E0JI99_ORYPU